MKRDQFQVADANVFSLGILLLVTKMATYPWDEAHEIDTRYMRATGNKTTS